MIIPIVINVSAVLKIVYGGNSCHNKKSTTPPLCKKRSIRLPKVPAIIKLNPNALVIDFANNNQIIPVILIKKANVVKKTRWFWKKLKAEP